MQRYTMVFIIINALHVSGGSSAHHQEFKTVYTASGICSAFANGWFCLNTLTMHSPMNVKFKTLQEHILVIFFQV